MTVATRCRSLYCVSRPQPYNYSCSQPPGAGEQAGSQIWLIGSKRLDFKRLLNDYLPMNLVLHSERLTLTPYSLADADFAVELFSDPDVRKYTGGKMEEDAIRSKMPDWVRRGGNGCIGVWCIAKKNSGEKIGSAALLPIPADDDTDYSLVVPGQMPDGDIEIGYHLKKSAWGKGYATEAAQRLLQMAFEQSPLTEVVATFDPGNVASRKVLERVGFVNRGMRRCYGEEGVDYRFTREEWLLSKRR